MIYKVASIVTFVLILSFASQAMSGKEGTPKISMNGCTIDLGSEFEFRRSDGVNSYYFEKNNLGLGFIEVSSPYNIDEFSTESFVLLSSTEINDLTVKVYQYQVGELEAQTLSVIFGKNTAIKVYERSQNYSIRLAQNCK